jgi:hypothetical protein
MDSFRLGFEADAVDRAIDLGNAEYVRHELAEAIMLGEVDRLEADVLGVGEPPFVHIPDQHSCRAENACGCRGRETDRPCAGVEPAGRVTPASALTSTTIAPEEPTDMSIWADGSAGRPTTSWCPMRISTC